HVGVDLTVIVFPRNAFAPACKTNEGTVKTTVVFFQLRAISTASFGFLGSVRTERTSIVIFNTPSEAVAGHSHATANLNVVSAGEIQFLVIEPPGHVYVQAAYPVFVVPFPVQQLRKQTASGRAGGIVQIL